MFVKRTYLIFDFDFRLEIILPTRLLKKLRKIAGRFSNSKRGDASLHPYGSMHNESDAFIYAKKLEKMSQREMINRICYLEEKM